jgi:hypothetical protein
MKNPSLGKLKSKAITEHRKLSSDEFNRFEIYRKEIRDYVHMGELLSVALLNYNEFTESLKSFLGTAGQRTDIILKNRERIVFDLNRRILNYLSGVKTFLDHTAKRISSTCGKDQLEHFNEICSYQYDESFAYRFLYRLRNYTQHCGMPIGRLITESRSDQNEKISSNFTFAFDRDSLLSEFDGWGASVKSELQKQEAYFDVPSLLDEFMYRIGIVHIETMSSVYPDASDAANCVLSLYRELNDTDCLPVIFEANLENKANIKLKMIELPVHNAEWVLQDASKKKA